MNRRFAWLFAGLFALSAVQSDPSIDSVGPTTPSDHIRLLQGSAGCSSWQNDRYHYYRPPRRLPSDPVPSTDSSEELDLSTLEARAGSFGGDIPDLNGTWARLLVTSSTTNAPIIGEFQMTTSTIQRLVQTQRGDELEIAVDVCLIEVDSEGPMQTIIPDAFVAGIGRTERRARLEPLGDGFRFRQERLVRLLGFELDSPESGPIPTDDDDPTVVDQDGDGHPGMTVQVNGVIRGEVYTAQRITRDLEGVVRDLNSIDGYIAWTMEQSTLAASSFMLNVNSTPTVDPVVEHNYFLTTRIDERQDCAAIIAERNALFER